MEQRLVAAKKIYKYTGHTYTLICPIALSASRKSYDIYGSRTLSGRTQYSFDSLSV